MGKYEKKIAAGRSNMSPAQIREMKNERAKARNTRRRAKRRAAAEERQEAWAKMTPQQQLKALDGRLGKGVGAKKQRARIQERIDGS
jgi:hypothetical protein